MTKTYDVIILGAGAAGLMCAIEAAKRGRSVLVIERNDGVGKKIRISGGGRCNFTNIYTDASNFISSNPHFVKSALARFTPDDFSAILNRYKVPYHEKRLGQLFCNKSAEDIINVLLKECSRYNAEILLKTVPAKIIKEDFFILKSDGNTFSSKSLVVATGGLSVPSLGVSDLGYRIAKQFGININGPRPGLTPLVLSDKDIKTFGPLAGLSLDTVVRYKNVSFRENILFTHKGLSGPAILQISSYWKEGEPLFIDVLPGIDFINIVSKQHNKKITLKNILAQYLPKRFAELLCSSFIANNTLSRYSNNEIKKISDSLHNWEITPVKTEGYAKAEVTVGGIDTDELSSKTMESRKVSGLYFIGEVVDVTGHLGGFNFQWAWASGYSAGQYA